MSGKSLEKVFRDLFSRLFQTLRTFSRLFPDSRGVPGPVFFRRFQSCGPGGHGGELFSGSEKGVFWKRGLFRNVHFLEILENLEILEILENPQTVEKREESDHFLEILENLEILEILEIPPAKRPLS